MLSRLNSGFRHFSVPLTLLILMLGVLPRRLALLRSTASSYGRLASYTTALLTVACLVSAVNAYPYYIPYVNALGTGRPTWRIVTGSDLDWGQSLPTARQFAETHDLPAIPVDPYSFADIKAFVPQGQLWNCQSPSISQAGMWAVVSSNAIPHRCKWLMAFPHEELAGGALIAVQLPARIPPAGSPGGPPASLPGSGHWATRSLNDLPVLFLDLLDHPEKFQYVATQLNTSGAAMLNGVVARVQRKLAGE